MIFVFHFVFILCFYDVYKINVFVTQKYVLRLRLFKNILIFLLCLLIFVNVYMLCISIELNLTFFFSFVFV
jgi:hypothetical protein